jgi:hypothetical protein
MSHLFQKFYRVDNKDTREIGGTGLGLYLSRRLAEIMGGRIWAESVYTKGSTFFVELPRISNQEVNRLAEQSALIAQEESNQMQILQPDIQTPEPVPIPPLPIVGQPTYNVPRGQALTPEQIAAYVAKQRELIQHQAPVQQTQIQSVPVQPTSPQPAPLVINHQPTPFQTTIRPQTISIPVRGQRQ